MVSIENIYTKNFAVTESISPIGNGNRSGLNGGPPQPCPIRGGFGSGFISFGALTPGGFGFGCPRPIPFPLSL